MRSAAVPVLVLVVVLAAVLAGVTAVPVAAHGNHLTADAQVVDGHVVAERAFLLADGYAVVHIDQGGSMGRAIGHTQLDAGPHSNLEIPVDEAFLSQIDGSATVWVTLHRSNGDGEFDPAEDTPLTGLQGNAAGTTIPIQVADDGNVNVVAREFSDQRIDESAVTIPRAETNASGHLAVSNGDGDVVGSTSLDAGVHENVTVDLDRTFYDLLPVNETTTLTATMYRDDGDGAFDASSDEAVAAAGSPVATTFTIQKVQNASRTTAIVITAAETSESNTPAPTTTPAPSETETGTPNTGPVPGFGVSLAALVLVGALALGGARARRR